MEVGCQGRVVTSFIIVGSAGSKTIKPLQLDMQFFGGGGGVRLLSIDKRYPSV